MWGAFAKLIGKGLLALVKNPKTLEVIGGLVQAKIAKGKQDDPANRPVDPSAPPAES